MGLDLYVGTLTRYYSRDWKNITQQLAEAKGLKCEMLDGCGNEIKPEQDKKVIEQIRDAVCQWADNLAANIEPPLQSPMWDEKGEHDYFTDKPDWMAYGALVMLQACRFLDSPLPEYVDTGWNAFDEPVVKKAMSQELPSSLLSDVSVWLPVPGKIYFAASLPNGNEVTFSTVEMLRQELDDLNQKMWEADEATILSWRNDKYYVPVAQKEPKLILGFIRRKSKDQKERYRTEELAQCAYSILYQAVNFAAQQQVPVLLDY